MRINRDTLLGIAGDTVAQRVRQDRGILSAYLCGSLLGDNFLLGGSADIDLVFIHIDTPPAEREIVRLTDEVHLDIAHYAQKVFREPRRLRQHPWLGPTIFSCRLLSDPQHFMDFTQASVRGQFEQPDHVLERARPQLGHARQIWEGVTRKGVGQAGAQEVGLYLKAIEHAVNAVACLSGAPLTERRLLLGFPERAAAARHPGLYPGLLGMLGAPRVIPEAIRPWLPQWEEMYAALPEAERPARLHPARRAYYLRAFRALLEGEQPQAVLWPLLRTWTNAITLLPPGHALQDAWQASCRELGLLDDAFTERVEALDAYLDMVDETLDGWARANGV
jgi:hypothetical protein